MGYLLYYVAVSLLWMLYVPFFVLSAVIDLVNTNRRLEDSALVLDVLAAVLFAPVWNVFLISPNAKRKFGELWLTMSEVLGWAQREGTLRPAGKLLVYMLHRLDPYHCEWAIGLRPEKPVRMWWQKALAILEVTLIFCLLLSVLTALLILPFWLVYHYPNA